MKKKLYRLRLIVTKLKSEFTSDIVDYRDTGKVFMLYKDIEGRINRKIHKKKINTIITNLKTDLPVSVIILYCFCFEENLKECKNKILSKGLYMLEQSYTSVNEAYIKMCTLYKKELSIVEDITNGYLTSTMVIDNSDIKGYCHLASNSINLLHEFTCLMGVPKSRFHNPKGKNKPHYDIKVSERDRFIKEGVIPISSRQMITYLKHHYGKF